MPQVELLAHSSNDIKCFQQPALGENAAAQATVKDLAEALYGIVAKHPDPEDVLYAMLQAHRKDASNVFKGPLAAFGVTWERKARSEKVPA